MKILGVRIDNLAKQEILEKVSYFLFDQKFHQIATINPEFILEAQKNEKFKNILNKCNLNIADGIGIKFSFWRFGKHLKCRLTGIDLMREILKMANDRGLSIFLAANKDGLSTWEETRDAILKIFPNMRIEGANLDLLDISCPIGHEMSIVLCDFGAPYQELFINSQKNANIKLAMGVGGSFDFFTGKIKRAPVFMRQIGLEWLWRLAQKPGDQPRRWKRIWRAVIIFPIKVIFNQNQ